MDKRKPISRAKAEAALKAVEVQFASYLEPLDMGETTLGPNCPPPKLVEAWSDGDWAICWEDGPDDWAHRATMGGTSEEERCLVAAAAREFGYDPEAAVARMKVDEPIKWPKGVYAEPYYSFVLVLYPE